MDTSEVCSGPHRPQSLLAKIAAARLLILRIPTQHLFLAVFFSGFVVLGPLLYFTGITQLTWAFQLAFLGIFGALALSRASHFKTLRIFHGCILAFLLIALAASIANAIGLLQFAVASRWYFYMWPAVFAMGLGILSARNLIEIWRMLMLVVLIQVPMALYQRFVVMEAARGVTNAWDVVVGTFPGRQDGGGQSSAMGMFLITMLLLVVALFRARLLSGLWLGIYTLVITIVLASMEVKSVLLLLPFTFALYFWRDSFNNPLSSLFALTIVCVVTLAIFNEYERLYESTERRIESDYDSPMIAAIMRAADPESQSWSGDRLGRVTLLVLWWETHVSNLNFAHLLLGYGIGATEQTRLVEGEIARKFDFSVGTSSANILLWEVGILGLAAFTLILIFGSLLSLRLARLDQVDPWSHVLLRVGGVFLILMIVTLPYKQFALRSFPIWLLITLTLGQAAYWHSLLSARQSPRPRALSAPAA